MPTSLFLLCILAATPAVPPSTAPSQPTMVEKKDAAGQVYARYQADADGRKSGKYEELFDDGKVKLRAMYRHDKRNGECVEFSPGGKIKRSAQYRDDVLSGAFTEYEPNGQVRLSAVYLGGKLNGPYKELQAGKVVKDQRWIDGELLYSKSPAQIDAVLAEIRRTKAEVLAPATEDGAARLGPPATEYQARWLRILNEYRYLCDLTYDVKLDESYNRLCLLTATCCRRLGHITHGPERNPGMKEEDFKQACTGAGHSNLASGGSDIIRMFMDDGKTGPLGHRRWCVNPRMGRTGFGLDGSFAAQWSMDGSGSGTFPPYGFVAFPPPGYIPSSHFEASWRWHITVDPSRYALPAADKLGITVTACQVRGSEIVKAKPVKVPLTLDTAGYGVANAIMFQPPGITTDGRTFFQVELSGVTPKGDQAQEPDADQDADADKVKDKEKDKAPKAKENTLSYYVLFYRR